ncbi:MAG: hypothetical protein ACRYFU_16585 [Janthinobacterium lividum]
MQKRSGNQGPAFNVSHTQGTRNGSSIVTTSPYRLWHHFHT